MPYSLTILRAMLVAFSMSFSAPVRDLAEDHLLGGMAAQGRGQHGFELALGHVVAIFGRQRPRVAAHHAARDDRHLVDRVVVLLEAHDHGVAALVIGRQLLLAVGHDAALALGAGDDAIDRFLELGHADRLLVAPRREDGALVDQVGQVGAREARASPCR